MRTTNTLISIIFAAAIVALQCSTASAAEPAHTPLFENDDKTFYRTPALVVTNKGTLIAVANSCDSPPTKESTHAAIVARRSTDGGKTWAPMQTLLDADGRRIKTGAGVVDPSTGEIMFFCAAWPKPQPPKPEETSEERMIQSRAPWGTGWAPAGSADDAADSVDDYVGYGILRSKDDGATWKFERVNIQGPKDKTEAHALYRFINTSGSDTGIALKSGPNKGRLLVPVCAMADQRAVYNFFHPRKMRIPWAQRTPYFPYCATTIYSDDHGKTWRAGGFGPAQAAESCVAELPDGSLYLNATASGGWRAECRGANGGESWDQFALANIRDGHSGCAGSIASIPIGSGDGACLVLTAPAHNESGFDSLRDRKKLTANVSLDGGKTWPVKKLVNEGPSGYSASVVGPDGSVFVLYEKGQNVYYDKGLSIVKLDPKWLQAEGE